MGGGKMSRPTLRWRIRNYFGMAIDWRVRDVLEAERQATIELGKTFVTSTAKLTDEIRLLEQRVAHLEKQIRLLGREPE